MYRNFLFRLNTTIHNNLFCYKPLLQNFLLCLFLLFDIVLEAVNPTSDRGKMPRKQTAAERRSPEIGQRLANARMARGYTQKQMAEVFGISDVAWRNYEKGRELKSGMIVQICAILECSPNWLLGINDEGMTLSHDDPHLKSLIELWNELSTDGQREALRRVRELSRLPEYQRGEQRDPVPSVVA